MRIVSSSTACWKAKRKAVKERKLCLPCHTRLIMESKQQSQSRLMHNLSHPSTIAATAKLHHLTIRPVWIIIRHHHDRRSRSTVTKFRPTWRSLTWQGSKRTSVRFHLTRTKCTRCETSHTTTWQAAWKRTRCRRTTRMLTWITSAKSNITRLLSHSWVQVRLKTTSHRQSAWGRPSLRSYRIQISTRLLSRTVCTRELSKPPNFLLRQSCPQKYLQRKGLEWGHNTRTTASTVKSKHTYNQCANLAGWSASIK